MIAVISSSISPETTVSGAVRSHFSESEREKQTFTAIDRLITFPFSQIVLVDNSSGYDFSKVNARYGNRITVIPCLQYQFANRGVNEILMLLSVLADLPADEPILKISGRYFPDEHFKFSMDPKADFKVRPYSFEKKRGSISTRAYFVRNKTIWEQFLLDSLNEVFVHPYKVVGPRSLLIRVKCLLGFGGGINHSIAIEFAAAQVLKRSGYTVEFASPIGVTGQIAGFASRDKICE